MPNQPNFPIPDDLTPDTFCLQLQIPNDPTWKQVFVSLLAQPTYWFNWQRDPARSGKQLAQYWTKLFDEIDWSDMSCCCDQPPAIFRYNEDNIYQMSTDGGVTWVDAPNFDYRNISTIFPPPSALGFDNTKCQNADSAVVILNEDVIQGLDNGSAVQAILEFIAAVLIFYLSAGTLATVAIGLFSMAAAIIGFGVAATKAAFTSTILDKLRCTIYSNMATDDSITTDGLQAILNDINTNYTGIVKTSLYSIISAAGVVGMTNMIRSNRGAADANCLHCDDTWCFEFDFTTQAYNAYWSSYDTASNPAVYNTHYVTGQGWQTSNSNPNYSVIKIPVLWTGHLTRVVITPDPGSDTMDMSLLSSATSDPIVNYAIADRFFDGSEPAYTYLAIGQRSRAMLTRVRLEGQGINPFGANNC